MATIVDIYCRLQASAEEDFSKQELACRAYCQQLGLTVGTIYRENASGSTYRNRELLTIMRKRYRSGQTQGVVVTALDRLSRSNVHLIILLQEMAAHDTAFYCVHDSTSDVTGRIVSLVLDILAEVEREKALDTSPTDI